MPDDMISGLIADLRKRHPEVPAHEWVTTEIRWRQEWGGERHYIVKAGQLGKAHALSESLAAGRSIREAGAAIGVHRSTCWRWLRRGWVKAF